jgi:alanine racemase
VSQGAFGERLKGVQQVDAAGGGGANTGAGVAAVDAHMDMLRPAIASYGASVEVCFRF